MNIDNTKHTMVMLDEEDYVAWCRYENGRINTCNSDDDGAFRVYKYITELEK